MRHASDTSDKKFSFYHIRSGKNNIQVWSEWNEPQHWDNSLAAALGIASLTPSIHLDSGLRRNDAGFFTRPLYSVVPAEAGTRYGVTFSRRSLNAPLLDSGLRRNDVTG